MDEAEHIAIRWEEEECRRTSPRMSSHYPIGKAPVASRSERERERAAEDDDRDGKQKSAEFA